MLSEFKKHVDIHFPFLSGRKLLVACSGGLDSVVLTHLCSQIGLDVTLAHCNFRLRGAESDGDAEFVVQLGAQLGVEVLQKGFDTKAFASTHRGSVQMAARELRYQWFSELIRDKEFDFVLTAHHADDALETFLINLSRGTGMEGLTGIPEVNNEVVRPLLVFSREQIATYAEKQSISWREDSSNADNKYLRNRIRNQIVPHLKALHPTFLQNFKQTQEYLQQSQALIQNHLNEIREGWHVADDGITQIKISDLEKLSPLPAYLYGLFECYGFTDFDALKALLKASSGKQVVSKTHTLLKDRAYLLLSKIKNRVEETFLVFEQGDKNDLPINLRLEIVGELEKFDDNTVYLDKEKLNFPLVLRKWEKGDYFYPFGMKGKKKLSKFFKDEKMDLISKENQWLLCSDEQIVWVLGRRADERFKVEESTRQIVKITWIA